MEKNRLQLLADLEAYQKREKYYRALIDDAVEGMLLVSQRGVLLDANQTLLDMLGYAREELLRQHIHTVIQPDPDGDSAWLQALGSGDFQLEGVFLKLKDEKVLRANLRVRQDTPNIYRVYVMPLGERSALSDLTQVGASERIKVFHEIEQAIQAGQSPQGVAQAAVNLIRRLIPANSISVIMFDPKTLEGEFIAVYGSAEEYLSQGSRFPFSFFGLKHFGNNIRPIVIEDLVGVRRLPWNLQLLKQYGIRSFISMPLIYRGDLNGLLNLGKREKGRLKPTERLILRQVGERLAYALWYSQHIQATQNKVDEVTGQYAAGMGGVLRDGEFAVIEAVSEIIQQAFRPVDYGILLLEREKNALVSHPTYHGIDPGMKDSVVPLGEGVAGKVAASGQLLRIADVRLFSGYIEVNPATQSELCVPLIVSGKVIGVINIESDQRDTYKQIDESLAQRIAEQLAVGIEKIRLINAERVRRIEAETLRGISATISSTLDLTQVLDDILVQLEKVVRYDSASVMLIDQNEFRVVAGRGFPDGRDVVGQAYPIDDALHLEIQSTKHPLVLPDAQKDSRFRNWGETYKVRGWMGVPLMVRDEIIGHLTVDSYQEGAYGEAEATMAQTFANQAALAIYNARLFETQQRHSSEIEGLYQAALATSSVLETKTLLLKVYEQVQRLISPDTFAVSIYDDNTDQIRMTLVVYGDKEKPELMDVSIPLDQSSLTGWVIRTKQPLHVRNLQTDIFKDELQKLPVPAKAWLGVPLIARERLVGALSVQSNRMGAFDDDHVRLLESFAAQTAIALENARLFEETRRKAVQLQVAAEVARDATAASGMNELLNRAVRLVRDRFGFYHVAIFLVDETAEYANLRAATGQAGRKMLDLGYRVQVGKAGMVGHVAATGQAWVAETLDHDSDNLRNPYLPESRAEIVLPLKVGTRILGVLDVHSREESVFDDDEIKVLQTLADQLAVALGHASLYKELEDAYVQTVLSLANAMEVRDRYTSDHSQRVVAWAEEVARKLGCTEEEIKSIHWGALLHDIGKIGVPDAILRKPGKLTDEEWEVMRQHPELGAQIIAPVKSLENVTPIIRAHQEEFNGSGYPYGLQGEEIPLGARILAVVDAYSAIVDERVYRRGRSHTEAIQEMRRCAGSQFDPKVVQVFLDVIQGRKGNPLLRGDYLS